MTLFLKATPSKQGPVSKQKQGSFGFQVVFAYISAFWNQRFLEPSVPTASGFQRIQVETNGNFQGVESLLDELSLDFFVFWPMCLKTLHKLIHKKYTDLWKSGTN